jgi:hypothetical protein
MKKGAVAIIIAVVLALVAGIGGTLVYQKLTRKPVANDQRQESEGQTSNPSPSPDETANWKTYTNLKYSFKYPTELELTETPDQASGFTIVSLKNDKYLHGYFININTWTNDQRKSLRQFIIDYTNGAVDGERIKSYSVNQEGWMGYVDKAGKTLFLDKNLEVHVALLNKYPPYNSVMTEDLNSETDKIFSKILSTFQFTE